MSKFRVAIVGGGISGLCLAGELLKAGDIQVDVYEASDKFDEIGAGITLWGRIFDAMRLMGLADDCIKASVVAASSTGISSTTGYKLRGYHQPDVSFGSLWPDAWSLHRADLLKILLHRVPESNAHLGKRLKNYIHKDATQTVEIEFLDGTSATCDVLIGCDGIRSPTRIQMLRQEAQAVGIEGDIQGAEPRWSGTIAYRALIPTSRLLAKNPQHSVIFGGQMYCGKNQSIVAYPISQTTINIVVGITDLSKENTRWPAPSWSRKFEQNQFAEDIAPLFADWDEEPRELIQAIDTATEWAVHDLEPLPYYTKGRVALVGDAAHGSTPYMGAGAAHAIEDAYVLSRVLSADAANRETLPLALEAYQTIRLPYGNRHTLAARKGLRISQYNGPSEDDMNKISETYVRITKERLGTGGSGPETDANKAISLLEKRSGA